MEIVEQYKALVSQVGYYELLASQIGILPEAKEHLAKLADLTLAGLFLYQARIVVENPGFFKVIKADLKVLEGICANFASPNSPLRQVVRPFNRCTIQMPVMGGN